MATTCDYCGWKTNEVKSGAGISETGIRINLKLTDPSDLNRDVLKVGNHQSLYQHLLSTLWEPTNICSCSTSLMVPYVSLAYIHVTIG